jgi:transcriptional regulator with PAS, ATPase and Fis domain
MKVTVERAALLCNEHGIVGIEALSLPPRSTTASWESPVGVLSTPPPVNDPSLFPCAEADILARELWGLIVRDNLSLGEAIEHCERVLIGAALQAEANNRTRAAHRLGIHIRTIFKKLKSCRPTDMPDRDAHGWSTRACG